MGAWSERAGGAPLIPFAAVKSSVAPGNVQKLDHRETQGIRHPIPIDVKTAFGPVSRAM
jgi:hypothetical protein